MPFLFALAQLIPNRPPDVVIRAGAPGVSSLQPTALSAPPAERLSTERRLLEQVAPPSSKPRSHKKRWLAAGAALLVALGAVVITHRPAMKPEIASGRAGPKLTPSGVPEHWMESEVPFIVDESLTTVWPDATVGVEQAFDTWRAANDKLPRITVDARKAGQLLLEPDGENRIYYAPIPVAGFESALGITLQYADQTTGEIVEADIIINSRHPFALLEPTDPKASAKVRGDSDDSNEDGNSQGNSNGQGTVGQATQASTVASSGNVSDCKAKYDVASVVTHEIGHFWGLGEDMIDTTATMYFSTPPCNVIKRELKLDDVAAVSSLYTVPASSSSSAPDAKHCSVTTLGSTRGDGTLLVGLATALAAAARRRRRGTVR